MDQRQCRARVQGRLFGTAHGPALRALQHRRAGGKAPIIGASPLRQPAMTPLIEPVPFQGREVLRVRADVRSVVPDTILDEVPVALVYNGLSHAVMMATPADLEEFALGFSLSEGILASASQCYGIEVEPECDGIAVQLDVASEAFLALKERRRSLAGRTGCGLCGVDSLRAVRRPLAPVTRGPVLAPAAVARALEAIGAHQHLARATGAAHAVAWCDLDGAPVIVREDVGRHNALDKVIGAMVRAETAPDTGFLLATSRLSLEMAQKAAAVGVAVLAGMSAPTLAGIELAEGAGMTLLAFARGDGFVCYTRPDRLRGR